MRRTGDGEQSGVDDVADELHPTDDRDATAPFAAEDVPGTIASAGDAGDAAVPDLPARVDAELDRLTDLPLAAHPEVYARVHSTLNRELADIDGA